MLLPEQWAYVDLIETRLLPEPRVRLFELRDPEVELAGVELRFDGHGFTIGGNRLLPGEAHDCDVGKLVYLGTAQPAHAREHGILRKDETAYVELVAGELPEDVGKVWALRRIDSNIGVTDWACDIVLRVRSPTPISRINTVISFASGAFHVRDRGSTNGTRVNGVLLADEERRRLEVGDLIDIGGWLDEATGALKRRTQLLFHGAELAARR